jgi:hypothetical protein
MYAMGRPSVGAGGRVGRPAHIGVAPVGGSGDPPTSEREVEGRSFNLRRDETFPPFR